MSARTNPAHTYFKALVAAGSRATAEEFDTKTDLILRVKKGNVLHSETASDFEAPLPVGVAGHPLKQRQEQQQNQSKASSSKSKEEGDWNHNQPKGPSAELLMAYPNGSRSFPFGATIFDRSVNWYNFKTEGDNAFYHFSGSEQGLFFNDQGAYLISLNGKSVKDPKANDTRMASLRHVTKDMQTHEIKEGQQQEEYKHEGKTVNTEVRCTKDRIEFLAGTKVVGYYEVSSDTWYFTGKLIHNKATEEIKDEAKTMNRSASSSIKDAAPKIDHN